MATKNESQEKPESAPKKKGKLLKIMLALAVFASGGGGVTWYMMKQSAIEQEAAALQEKPPTFLNFDSFTVNLQPEAEGQYLQVGLTLKLTEPSTAETIKLHTPEIRNRILLLLSDKKASEISSSEGKQQLSTEILDVTRKSILSEKTQQEIIDVLFTSFVIQ